MTKAVIRGFINRLGGISICNLLTRMFIFVTINAQKFPVTSIRRIIVMIVIFVVYG